MDLRKQLVLLRLHPHLFCFFSVPIQNNVSVMTLMQQIKLKFEKRDYYSGGTGPDPPQLPPWVWAWNPPPSPLGPGIAQQPPPWTRTPPQSRHTPQYRQPPPRSRQTPPREQAPPSPWTDTQVLRVVIIG